MELTGTNKPCGLTNSFFVRDQLKAAEKHRQHIQLSLFFDCQQVTDGNNRRNRQQRPELGQAGRRTIACYVSRPDRPKAGYFDGYADFVDVANNRDDDRARFVAICFRITDQTRLAFFARLFFFGGHSEGVTPVPIPNTEVKPLSADGTARETWWESRSPPNPFEQAPVTVIPVAGAFFVGDYPPKKSPGQKTARPGRRCGSRPRG